MESYPTHTTLSKAPTGSTRRGSSTATLWALLLSLAALIPVIAVCGTIIIFQIFELNLPGIHIYDQSVGMKSYEDTAAWIDSYWNHARLIRLSHPEDPTYEYFVSPEDLGYWVDPVATAKAAYDLGRGSAPLPELLAALSGRKQIVLPVMYYDIDVARQTLQALEDDLAVPVQEARIEYQNGKWAAIPGIPGQNVNIDGTLNHLYENAFAIFLEQSVTLEMITIPPEVADLSPILDDVEDLLAKDMVLSAYDPIMDETLTWSIPAEIKQAWVDIDPDTLDIRLRYDSDDIAGLIEAWEEALDDGREIVLNSDSDDLLEAWNNENILATIHHPPTQYQVGVGESLWSISLKLGIPMWYIMDTNNGLTTSNLNAGMTLTIPSKNDLLPLPVIPDKRIVIDISDQRMTVYENGQVRSTHIVSTGVSDSPTMAGIFQIQTHELNAYASNWDLYMPHFMGIYEAWPGFMNGIHGLPLLSSGHRLWASNLGTPVSYGCIILDLPAAEDLYHWAEPGVVVEITR